VNRSAEIAEDQVDCCCGSIAKLSVVRQELRQESTPEACLPTRVWTIHDSSPRASIALRANRLSHTPSKAVCSGGLIPRLRESRQAPSEMVRLRQFTTPFAQGSGTCPPSNPGQEGRTDRGYRDEASNPALLCPSRSCPFHMVIEPIRPPSQDGVPICVLARSSSAIVTRYYMHPRHER